MGVTAVAVTFHLVVGKNVSLFMLCFYLFGAAIVAFYMGAYTKGRRFTHLPVAQGRVVAIVPTYNDEPELLYNCIWSLIEQSRPPDEIHVVDDGSKVPVEPFDHPLVHWHHKPNGGKRDAQAWVLNRLDPITTDYLLTVDGDSVLDSRAVEHLLRSMSNPEVQASTGLILVRNWRTNLLTRLTDVNIGTSCLMVRTSRSLIGAVETTSGALAMYRSAVVFDNLADYLDSGTNGDDRRLTMYALLRGQVVVVNEAIVHSAMPTTLGDMYKQRVRWGKSGWQVMPFSVINLSMRQLFFPMVSLIGWVVLPIFLFWAAYEAIFADHASQVGAALGLALFIRYGQTSLYYITRPGMRGWVKFYSWLFLTPVEKCLNLFFICVAKYHALFKLKNRGWETRGDAHAGVTGGRHLARPAWAARLVYVGVVLIASAGAVLSIWMVRHESTNPSTPVVISAGSGPNLNLFDNKPAPWERPEKASPSPAADPTAPAAVSDRPRAVERSRRTATSTPTARPSARPTTTRPTINVPTLPTQTSSSASPTPTPTESVSPSPTESGEPVVDIEVPAGEQSP